MKTGSFILTSVIASLFILSSCSVKENVLKEKIIGVWVCEEINDKDIPTNEKFVSIFLENGTQIYAAGYYISQNNNTWKENSCPYSVSGHNIIIQHSIKDEAGEDWSMVLDVKKIDDDGIDYKVKSMTVNSAPKDDNKSYHLEKADENYSLSIIGLWEGRNVTPGVSAADSPLRRWEYKDDGTYNYYISKTENGNTVWVLKEDNQSTYKLYGDLLASVWSNDEISGVKGTNFECWDIEISSEGMEWEGRRENNEMVYFSMKKIK
jgi:hypothetical protein